MPSSKIALILSFALLQHIAVAAPVKPIYGYIENFSCSDGPFSLRLPSDAQAFAQLGPVLQRGTGEIEEWESYRTTRTYVRYPGLDLGYIAFSNEPARYMISYIEVTTPDWRVTGPFKVGDLVSTIRRVLGPVAQDDSELKRQYGNEGDGLTFEQVGGRITKIRYDCYTG
jgi:hypothetical protein